MVFVDKSSVKHPDRFERCVDAQSAYDCNFQLVGSTLFGKFMSKLISQVFISTFLKIWKCFKTPCFRVCKTRPYQNTRSSLTVGWTRWLRIDCLSQGKKTRIFSSLSENHYVLLLNIYVQVKIEREGEIWSMDRNTHFDSRGRLINNARLVWGTPDISPKFALIQEVRFGL